MAIDRAHHHRLRSALGLFVLAPLIGEFLLGNQPVTALPSVFLLAPLYGGGALLVREAARRAGRGWPTMILLGAAYGLFEEGPVDQMLWNPHYGGFDLAAAYAGPRVPVLDTSVQLLQDVLTLHTVWSICVPIALVEAFARGGDRTRPWLGLPGLSVTALVFVGGSGFLALAQVESEDFVAAPGQFAAAGCVIAVLVAVAFLIRPTGGRGAAPLPRPWVVGASAFAATSAYWGREHLPDGVPAAVPVLGWAVLLAAVLVPCVRWSRSAGWGGAHRTALAGGALLTYVWVGFEQSRYLEVSRATQLLGSALFATGALVLQAVAVHRSGRREGSDPPLV
ncbi:hypothetical protein [Streptomyces sp. ITFR-16]|uniref:hypothetical protein n=1 Tax=Streptomyces sp. ITFR-16 TaxID=3075198 RepID=UPI00288C3E71|nr:hypothetical protein [Streptomyces sp. ITFR-16]WNI24215.1 hypothetical protein RLT58_20915 [Streptomyces sp. ITFR-16]